MSRKHNTMFYRALLLTSANLALRMVSLGFQVYLSGRVGAAGIGLLQLTMSVCTLAMTAGMGGIRTSAMYLTAEELGKGRRGTSGRVLSACFRYSLVCSVSIALPVYFFAPTFAAGWIGDIRVVTAIRIFAAFLPVTCLVGVLTGFYTAAGRVKTLVAVEVAEQLVSMGATVVFLLLWAEDDPGNACACIIGGSCTASVLTFICLFVLRGKDAPGSASISSPITSRLLRVAVPLAFADIFRMGISTVENLIVPRRLGLFSDPQTALAAYGRICGMVFPVLMFPACILYSIAELLIPELSRCSAGNRRRRISYLTTRSLRVSYVYGLASAGVLFTAAEGLGAVLYHSAEVGSHLRLYALLVPMLYTDAITDSVIKGMGQQVACVRYNTITSFLDVVFLWLLLPSVGLKGYFLSFLVTHCLNFCLSVRRLSRVTGFRPHWSVVFRGLAAAAASIGICSLLPQAENTGGILLSGGLYLLTFFLSAYLAGVVGAEDLHWLKGLVRPGSIPPDNAPPA